MDTLLSDIRYALRTLRRTPAFSVAAVICLALGIGANSAIFSVVNSVLLRPLPFRDPGRLVTVWETNTTREKSRNVVSPADYLEWKAQNAVFSDMAAFVDWRASLSGLERPEEVPVELATASLFTTLGVSPVLGRVYTAEEDAPPRQSVVVLGYALWQRLFAGSPAVLGRRLIVGGTPHTIVGVMPRDFGATGIPNMGSASHEGPQLWMPLALDRAVDYRKVTGRYLTSVARLRPGVTAARAQSGMDAIGLRLQQSYPEFNGGWGVNVVPLAEQVLGGVRRSLLVLAGVVAFVLLIACANVANLQLARGAARQREIAVRAALGAARGRVVRQLLTESIVLAVIGGAVGLMLAYWGTETLRVLASASLPRVREVGLDATTVVFTTGLALLTGVIFGLLPALHAARADLQHVLKEGARGSTRTTGMRGTLLVAQIALSVVLLVGAGLLIKSFRRLQAEMPGFNPEHVLTARIDLPGRTYDTPAKQNAFFDALLTQARRLPGVRSASAVNWLPFGGLGSATSYFIEGRPRPRPEDEPVADIRGADPAYFRTMEIAVRRGEPFTERDGPDARKAIVVNETLARTMFPNQNPLGQHILMPWGDTLRGEIVGVVADTKHTGLDSLPRSMIYWAMRQFPSNFMTLVVRTTGDPLAVAPALQGVVRGLDPEQPVADIKPLEDYLSQSVAQRRFSMMLMGAFAAIALVLAAVGISGVLAYAVTQRTREIGVRMALGAAQGDVQAMVIREGLRVTVVGLGIGLVGALVLTRIMSTLLYATSATDPATFAGVAVALGGVAALASWLPARRAARVDPVVALREE